jgi:tetratricopeptide (TPR) repeat protein
VYEQLTDEANSRWLLILDNADDTEVFFPPTDVNSKAQGELGGMARYLPHNSSGSIIITTRDARLGRKLANGEKRIAVLQMTIQEAKTMMLSRVSESCCEPDLGQLLDSLEYLPLAITQAAAFIIETNITLSEYLDLLNQDDAGILSKEFDDWRRDPETSNSVIQTWKLSFDQIKRQNPRATDLLSLMAVLDRQGIQPLLLRGNNEQEAEFVTALGILQAFSLIASEKGGKVFQMHRLVQLATQRWLDLHGTSTKWQEQALRVLSEKFPPGIYENWALCEVLSPHVQAILRCTFELKSCILQYAELLNNSGLYDRAQGRYKAAYEKLSNALMKREKVLGKEHPDTLTSVNNLATVLKDQGKYEAAEGMYRRALDSWEKVLGKEYPGIIISISNLAGVLRDQGKYNAAEEMCRRVLDSWEKVFGKEHLGILISINNLAGVLRDQGKYKAAEEMCRRVLNSREKVLGKEHPETLISVNNLAGVLRDQGEYNMVEEMNRRVLDGIEKVLGKEHPETLISVNNLAGVLRDQGKYEAAEEMYRRALNSREKVLGKEHPDTLRSINNLARVL